MDDGSYTYGQLKFNVGEGWVSPFETSPTFLNERIYFALRIYCRACFSSLLRCRHRFLCPESGHPPLLCICRLY